MVLVGSNLRLQPDARFRKTDIELVEKVSLCCRMQGEDGVISSENLRACIASSFQKCVFAFGL